MIHRQLNWSEGNGRIPLLCNIRARLVLSLPRLNNYKVRKENETIYMCIYWIAATTTVQYEYLMIKQVSHTHTVIYYISVMSNHTSCNCNHTSYNQALHAITYHIVCVPLRTKCHEVSIIFTMYFPL